MYVGLQEHETMALSVYPYSNHDIIAHHRISNESEEKEGNKHE